MSETPLRCINPVHTEYYLTDDQTVASGNLETLLEEFHTLWWRSTVSLEWLHKAIVNSYCIVIVHAPTNTRVGFARCITDYCGFSRLTDVYILPPHRHKGLATWMIQWILNASRLKDVSKHELLCRDAEVPLYTGVGFSVSTDELHRMHVKKS